MPSDEAAQAFGDRLLLHHHLSEEPFSKDKFEYGLLEVLAFFGIEAALARRNNPGSDITIAGVPYALKTEAAKRVNKDELHISKWMELGRGSWTNKLEDLEALRQQFFDHLGNYERILVLRRLSSASNITYELVEIPKALLLEAKDSPCVFSDRQYQEGRPHPGACTVTDQEGTRFQLYFDGGGERKLQIRKIRKALCVVHATWTFALPQ